MTTPSPQSFERIKKAFGYSIQGLKAAYRSEPAFREEIWASLVLIPLAIGLPVSWTQTAFLIGSVLFVMIVELLNTGIECVVDRIGPEHHPLSGQAKDVASAAVLLALILAGLVWLVVLGELIHRCFL